MVKGKGNIPKAFFPEEKRGVYIGVSALIIEIIGQGIALGKGTFRKPFPVSDSKL
ncbi:hypothetical protein IMSAGC009_03010 [Lachnospiraceae bacterium]|nr:hypothetical protein IMSAGC009_03010 [Lachnospiraceae bacterium]